MSEKIKTWSLTGFEKHDYNGIKGWGYEEVCQKALWAGFKYLSKCDQPEKILDKTSGFKNVYGLVQTPESAKELEELWSKMDKEIFHGWTGAQHQCVVQHLQFIAKNGYQKWYEELKQAREPSEEYQFDLDKMELIQE